MGKYLIRIGSILALTLFSKCDGSRRTDTTAEQKAINLVNNIDNSALSRFKEYGYGRRGDYDFWEKLSSDTTLYTCSYRIQDDTTKLTVFRPLNFTKDFSSTFKFDTSYYYQFAFFERNDIIVKIVRVDNHGQHHVSDTLVSTKQLFPRNNPFTKFAELTRLKDKLNIIGRSYRNDIGEFLVFWITPQYKLTYLPDSTKMNPNDFL